MFRSLLTRNSQLTRPVTPQRFLGCAFESTVAEQKLVAYPYFINRTRFQTLPVYTDIRNAGTRTLTLVRRIDGDVEALRNDLAAALEDNTVEIRKVSRQIVIRGNRINEVREWLTKKGF
ncbi:mitochondrial 54S ribosomal protein img2 [Linderina macrospora]|uniref:Mitochondrial 54S ribosomal protein img2 n=1 Tax=Linderina macrospora TaxID=4868 RepID=A0ACC1JD63_9FUNG|nr:mitochondrial 54S ribosomal protein img2 [Linderina macrospora]